MTDRLCPLDHTDDTPIRCRASVDGRRCDFRGSRDELADHADEVGHPRCVVPCGRDANGNPQRCGRTLTEFEQQTCSRCAADVRDHLDAVAVAFAHLERVIGEGAYHGMFWNALAMSGDGSVLGGGQDDHIRYHDPLPPVAVLESWDRDWRETFGHRITYRPLGHPDRAPKVVLAECLDYLRTWHALAARTHPAFDDYATEIRSLRFALERVVGTAEAQVTAPIPCACGGRLERRYAERGLTDDWTCRSCGTGYTAADYVWRLRLLTEVPGWVSVERAAADTDRPTATVWAWVCSLDVPSLCSRATRRVVVELAAVQERSEATPRQSRRSA